MVVAEKEEERLERENTLSERVPPLKFFGLALVDLQLLSHPTVPHSLVQPFLHLKGLRQEGKHGGCIRLLTVAGQMLEVETEEKKREREEALAERVPPLKLSGLSVDELMSHELGLKIIELQSKFKKPTLKKVKISAEMMLSVLLGSKHKETIDFKSNLKTVKKAEEKKEEVTDWRQNVDAMSGMEGRKKMFDA
ncbi:troponin I, slow skeletal muscle isoform X2 [Coregonus clupeaformis]|uniref:troponin I, slow skeletal muscle isoform X2 n=1 Tax=Coregonus clupeaformis TaxID=59861 RepID=UPI001BDF97BA|nr:troponin I, slow skeletal muscle isoform X2 [Coregonus clupeaformis]